jgi:predicted O-methyltransferase YrrM
LAAPTSIGLATESELMHSQFAPPRQRTGDRRTVGDGPDFVPILQPSGPARFSEPALKEPVPVFDRYLAAVQRAARRLLKRPAIFRAAPPGVDVRVGSLSVAEQRFLNDLVRESAVHPGPIIEIGTLIGATTSRMALCKSPSQCILTVDNYCWNPWRLPPDLHHALAAQVLFYLVESSQVEQVRMDKREFFRRYDGPAPALVFLDAWHTYEETKADIEWARGVGAAIVCGHDYSAQFPGVQRAVDEFGGPARQVDSLWRL